MRQGISTAHSVVEPTARTRIVAGVLVALYAFITIVPLAWIILTGFKTQSDAISYPPKIVFTPTIDGYCNLFTTRSRQTPEYIAGLPAASGACEKVARDANMVELHTALCQFVDYRVWLYRTLRWVWGDGSVRVFPVQSAAQR
jgi:multiple sugar transport system permease protein